MTIIDQINGLYRCLHSSDSDTVVFTQKSHKQLFGSDGFYALVGPEGCWNKAPTVRLVSMNPDAFGHRDSILLSFTKYLLLTEICKEFTYSDKEYYDVLYYISRTDD
jgi:hypothetical protein